MNEQKIAVMVDTGTDVPQAYCKSHPIYIVPLKVIYRDREYSDGVDITPQQVYDRLHEEVPKTSLPDSDTISHAFTQIENAGHKHVLCISISSALSGTANMMRLVSHQHPSLDCRMIDTKNIGIGAGMQAIYACDMIDKGLSIDTICEKLEQCVKHTKVFFCVATLEYLAKGGRISRVAATLGSVLNLKPVITCDEHGAYIIAAKVRGRAKSLAETITLALSDIGDSRDFRIAIANGGADEDAEKVMETVKQKMPQCREFLRSTVSPALGVHTGPGLIGVCVQIMDR